MLQSSTFNFLHHTQIVIYIYIYTPILSFPARGPVGPTGCYRNSWPVTATVGGNGGGNSAGGGVGGGGGAGVCVRVAG